MDFVPNLFPIYKYKETAEIESCGKLKSCGFIITFLGSLIGLTVYYALQEALIETVVTDPNYSKYQDIQKYNPVCPCKVATTKLSLISNITLEQDQICSHFPIARAACKAGDECAEDQLLSKLDGLISICAASNVLIAAASKNFYETSFVAPNLVASSELATSIQATAESEQRNLEMMLRAAIDISEARDTVNMPVFSVDTLEVPLDDYYYENISDVVRTGQTHVLGAIPSPYAENDTQHDCWKNWKPEECSVFSDILNTDFSSMLNPSWWNDVLTDIDDTTTNRSAFIFTSDFDSDAVLSELVYAGFAPIVTSVTYHEKHFGICDPAECKYTRQETRTFSEILTALAAFVGGLQAALTFLFSMCPTGESKIETAADNRDEESRMKY